jgi:Na+/proline symporter
MPCPVFAGATIQVLLFAVLAIEIKRKAPTAHTVLEIIKARWGVPAHLVFLVFCSLTNLIVTGMLILGGAAVVTALTGEGSCLPAFCLAGRPCALNLEPAAHCIVTIGQ